MVLLFLSFILLVSSRFPGDGCDCAGGKIKVFSYETIPTNDAGGDCVGGCGGNPFNFHSYGSTVSSMMAWLGGQNDGLRALYVELFDGNKTVIGSIPAAGPDASITFSPGETLVDDFQIDGNGIGSRVGFISFTTSRGQKFQVGQQHTPYLFPSGNSFLCGFFGQGSSEVDQVGFYMMKTISSAVMNQVAYPTLNSYTYGLQPKVYTANLCNDDPSTPQQQEAIFTKNEGQDYSWSVTASFSMGGSISFEAGIPIIAQVKGEFHWQVGGSSTYNQSSHTAHSQEMEFPVTVPPRTKIIANFQWWDSGCSVPYTGNLNYAFSDGTNTNFPIKDSFTGTYITDVTADYHSIPLQPNQDCNSA